MNRQEALEWLVENVAKWPTAAKCGVLCDWGFVLTCGKYVVFSDENYIITQQDWLDATDTM